MPNDENVYATLTQKLIPTTILIISRARHHYEFKLFIKIQNVILMRRYLCIYNAPFLEQNYSVRSQNF